MEPTTPEPAGKKILIIEDEQFISEIYSRELGKAGFIVATQADGVSGLEALEKDTYDLLLLDVLLPNMHGLEVLKQWKAKHPKSNMIVLLLTNLGQDDVISQAFALGAHGYLIKASYTPKQVVNEVINAFNGQPSGGTPNNPPPFVPQTPPPTPADQATTIDQPTTPPVTPAQDPAQIPSSPTPPPQNPPAPETPPQVSPILDTAEKSK